MGTVISKGVNGFGAVLGNAFIAPFRAIFGDSCEEVCQGTWDIICFLEHLCVSNIIRLLMVLGLTYITLLFFYLIFKMGIIQCLVRGFCKMGWAACQACWSTLESITCFLCYKLRNTKRVYRGHNRRYDLENGYSSSSDDGSGRNLKYYSRGSLRRRENRRREHRRRSLHQVRWGSGRRKGGYRHHLNLKTSDVSVHLRTDKLRSRMTGKRMGFKRRRI